MGGVFGLEGVDAPATLSACPFGVAVLDAELRFLFVNETLARINTVKAEAHLGMHPTELFPSAATRRWVSLAESVLSSGVAIGPVRLAFSEFSSAYDATYSPLVAGSAVRGVVVTLFDVTEIAAVERRQTRLTEAMSTLARARTRDEVATGLLGSIGGAFADRVAFGFVDADAVTIAAMSGFPSEVVERFADQPIPIDAPHAACDAVRERASVVLDGDAFDTRYPQHAWLRRSTGDTAIAAVPVMSSEVVLGVLLCGWSEPVRGAAVDVDLVVSIAAVAGGAIRRVDLAAEVADDRFRRALNASVDSVAITRAVRNSSGEIVDFVIEHANEQGVDSYSRPVVDLVGRSVLESYPGLIESGLFARFRDVVESGTALIASEERYVDAFADPPVETWHQMHVVRFDDGYLASTRDVTAEVHTRRQLESARVVAESEARAIELLGEIGAPTALPVSDRYTVAASYVPADAATPIGGDWYDVFEFDDGRLGVTVGDVAGHGRAAAVAMVELRALLKAHVRSARRPRNVLAGVRRHARSLPDMATCLYALIDPVAQTANIASAGHPPPVVASGDGVTVVQLDPGPPIGIGLDGRDRETTVELRHGASLIMYTDGLIERRRESLEVGLWRLRDTIDPYLTAPAQCDHLIRGLRPDVLEDDLCTVVVRIESVASSLGR
ncbi:MAG: SpoIIE family protein phosphatase [Acidimicrobiales bacterium]